jgi:hypothetical protein
VRDHAGGKYQPCFLRCGINRSQQATSRDPGPARLRINRDLAHSRQINYQAAVACAETCEAVPSTADGSKKSGLSARSDCVLHIAYICAARDKAGGASYHAVPNGTRAFVAAFAGTQQITFESTVERRVNFFAGFHHLVISLRDVFI